MESIVVDVVTVDVEMVDTKGSAEIEGIGICMVRIGFAWLVGMVVVIVGLEVIEDGLRDKRVDTGVMQMAETKVVVGEEGHLMGFAEWSIQT